MRASAAEIFGNPEGETAMQPESSGALMQRHLEDLTSSRLNSELYRMSVGFIALTAVSAAFQALRLCSYLSSPTLHTIQSQVRSRL